MQSWVRAPVSFKHSQTCECHWFRGCVFGFFLSPIKCPSHHHMPTPRQDSDGVARHAQCLVHGVPRRHRHEEARGS
eukprot:3368287-Alexandrium_andersonii.AAC.1